MRIDRYGQPIYTELDLCSLFLQDPDRIIKQAFTSDTIAFSENLSLGYAPNLQKYTEQTLSLKDYDQQNQSTWLMPESYINLDIAKWVLDQCSSDEELQRAGDELIKFNDRDMFVVLRYLKYLVDTMRKNKIVWGVGRGSSTASFVLYLIGIHRINSLYYQLDIAEFLK